MDKLEIQLHHFLQNEKIQEFDGVWSAAKESLKSQNQNVVYLKIQMSLKNKDIDMALKWIKKSFEYFWEENGILGRKEIHNLNLGKTARLVERLEVIHNILLQEQGSFTDETKVTDLFQGILLEELGCFEAALQKYSVYEKSVKREENIFKFLAQANFLRLQARLKGSPLLVGLYVDLSQLQQKNKTLYYSFEVQSSLLWFEYVQLDLVSAKGRFDSTLETPSISEYDKSLLYAEFLEILWMSNAKNFHIMPLNGVDLGQLSYFPKVLYQIMMEKKQNLEEDLKSFFAESFSLEKMKLLKNISESLRSTKKLEFQNLLSTLLPVDQAMWVNLK